MAERRRVGAIRGGVIETEAELDKSLKKSKRSDNSAWTMLPPKGITVWRFLTEPTGWFEFEEHYTGDDRPDGAPPTVPCTEGDCPFCEANVRKSRRYLANAVKVGDDDDDRAEDTINRVYPLVLPVTPAETIINRFKKKRRVGGKLVNTTIRNCDWEITHEGSGLDTRYRADRDDPSDMKVKKYLKEMFDLEQVLLGNLDRYYEALDEEAEEEGLPARRNRKPTRRRARDDDEDEYDDDYDEDDDDDEDEGEEEPPRRSRSTRSTRRRTTKRTTPKKMTKKRRTRR